MNTRNVIGNGKFCSQTIFSDNISQAYHHHLISREEDLKSTPLVIGPGGGGYIVLDESDSDAQTSCCEESDMCDSFYMYRPSDTCSRYAGAHAGK